jgi:hypothetical protein
MTADGAPLTHQLLEEEVTRWPFDEGEMKRRHRFLSSKGGAGTRCGGDGWNRNQRQCPCCRRRTTNELGP